MKQLPTPEDVAAAADPLQLRALLVLQLALTAGPLLFLGVSLALPFPAPGPEAAGAPPLDLLGPLHALLSLGVWGAALVVPARLLGRAGEDLRAHPPVDAAAAAAAWLGPFRSARILTLALLEGTALFGVGLLFLARAGGVLEARPHTWAHLAPLGVLLAFAAGSLPTGEAFGRAWRRHVLEGSSAAGE